jgi:protein SCO1/2
MAKKKTSDLKTAAPPVGASRRTLLLALLFGLAAGVATAVLLLANPNPAGVGQITTSGKALVGGPFTLTDPSGRRVTEKDFAGKPMLVYFGFTNCPDVCPAGLQVIAAALDRLGDKAKDVTPVFVTVDPERDTPEQLGKYVASFHQGIVGLSGSVDDIAAVTKAYRVYAKKVPDAERPGEYNVDHSSFMYLMDAKGEFVKHFPHSVDAQQLADEIAKQS